MASGIRDSRIGWPRFSGAYLLIVAGIAAACSAPKGASAEGSSGAGGNSNLGSAGSGASVGLIDTSDPDAGPDWIKDSSVGDNDGIGGTALHPPTLEPAGE